MIVVDSSVWIAHLHNVESAAVETLRALVGEREILVGDLILLKVLQGARDEAHAAVIERNLRQFIVAPMLGETLASEAARNYRRLRARGVTIRKTADVIIGSFCIAGGHGLLHEGRDFDPMVEHLGLQVV